MYQISNFEKWVLERICRKVVVQGGHKYRIIEYYRILVNAARDEFTEDNEPNLRGFLEQCHKDALEIKDLNCSK